MGGIDQVRPYVCLKSLYPLPIDHGQDLLMQNQFALRLIGFVLYLSYIDKTSVS